MNPEKIEDLYDATGYSADGSRENDPLGLHVYNCRHKHRVWFIGISELTDFKEDPEPAPVTIDGKTYDYYAVTQKMSEHEEYLRNPEMHCRDWNEKSIEEQEGLKRHWNKEIRNFKLSIQDRVAELQKRLLENGASLKPNLFK